MDTESSMPAGEITVCEHGIKSPVPSDYVISALYQVLDSVEPVMKAVEELLSWTPVDDHDPRLRKLADAYATIHSPADHP